MSAQEANNCRRCGSCCMQGGPGLHGPDLALIRDGSLLLDDLITIRCGELALPPLGGDPEPVTHEFLKLCGKNGSWCCAFYDETTHGCTRYTCRPMACGLLDCTHPEPLLAIAGKDLLTRFDCMAADDPLLPLVKEHEEICPCPDLHSLRLRLQQGPLPEEQLEELSVFVRRDLAFRGRVADQHQLSLGQELFYFGRPLFQLLQPLGLRTVQSASGPRVVAGY